MEFVNPVDRFKIILDLITKIPEFDGNSKYLLDFLDRVDAISVTIDSFEESAKVILMGYVKDKIVGRAKSEIQKHGRLNTWSEMKNVLKNNFGERLSIDKLIDSIRTARVQTTIEDYYNKINNFLCRINNTYLLGNNQDGINEMIESNNRIAFQAFKNNLPEPTKSIILSRNPSSLTAAFKIIVEINHQRYGPNTRFAQSDSCQNLNDSYSRNTNPTNPFNNNNFNTNSFTRNNNFSRGYNRQLNSSIVGQNQNNNHTGRQNYNSNSTGQSRQNYYNNSYVQPQQNNLSSNSGQSRQNYNNNMGQSRRTYNNLSVQSRQNNNNSNSNQTRNPTRQSNSEPMDISLNEQRQSQSSENQQNFQMDQRNTYPI
ncbi:uncharacterized protein DDB_G0292186-like [Episyrphus balteatus]|uniref:uncharacterized protein DDB_G0292186-like n=1 Tax=Episyrphus balteatus TaxID=286459 RepID=UPI002484F13F|nr:uncharacterized protein DDB_G0292186-like [Episyrphus balteatus]